MKLCQERTMNKLILAFMMLFSTAASSHVISILDTFLDMPVPEGYCIVDSNTDFYRFNQTALGNSVKILYMASDCKSVEALNSGKEKTLSHYIAFEQIGIKNRFIRFTFGDLFYVNMIRAFRLKDLSKYEERVNEKLEGMNITLTNLRSELVSSDDRSLTYRASATLNGFNQNVPVELNAVTFLFRQLPVAIHTYDCNPDEHSYKKSQTEISELKQRLP